MSDSVRATVRELLQKAVEGAQGEGLLPTIERPKRPEHGDYATNIALGLAKAAGKPPRVLGEGLAKHLRLVGGVDLAEASVAGPGFVNLRFSDKSVYKRGQPPNISKPATQWSPVL